MIIPPSTLGRLPLLPMARRLRLVHQQVPERAPHRWAFGWDSQRATLEFHKDNTFTCHRSGASGDLVDLAILYLTGAHDPGRAQEAAEWLSERLCAPSVWSPFSERSRRMVIHRRGRRNRWTDAVIQALTEPPGDLGPNVQEAMQALGALEVAWERWSVCMLAYEGEAIPCWMPGVPWLGQRVMRKPSGYFGGWTWRAARAHLEEPESGRLYIVDFDGDKTHGLPSIPLILRLCDALEQEGLPYRALVLSSFSHSPERAKVHLYFVADTPAGAEGPFRARHQYIEMAITRVVSGWTDVEPIEKLRLTRDLTTHQLTRLIRLPGFNKRKSHYASVIFDTQPGRSVAFDRLISNQPVTLEEPWADGVQRIWEFGPRCRLITRRQHGGEIHEVIREHGRAVWPVAHARDVETGAFGLQYRYKTVTGELRYDVLPARGWVDMDQADFAAADMATAGVQVVPGEGSGLAMALGQWAVRSEDAPLVRTVTRPGWHGHVYVNGAHVHGADWRWTGPRWRGQLRGDLSQWRDGLRHFQVDATRPLLLLAYGCALAGALLGPLAQPPFLLHLHGEAPQDVYDRARRLAWAVWFSPDLPHPDASRLQPHEALGFDGACLPLAEPRDNLAALLDLLDMRQPSPRHPTGQRTHGPRPERPLRLSLLTTGALPLGPALIHTRGDPARVGVLDLLPAAADLTPSARPTAFDRFTEACYGVAGHAWSRHLTRVGPEGHARLAVDLDQLAFHLTHLAPFPVAPRALRALALIGVALTDAHRAGLWPTDDPEPAVARLLLWACERLQRTWPRHTPAAAIAWDALRHVLRTRPAAFPTDAELNGAPPPQTALGVALIDETDRPGVTGVYGGVLSCQPMLNRSQTLRRFHVTAEQLLAWAQGRGLAQPYGGAPPPQEGRATARWCAR